MNRSLLTLVFLFLCAGACSDDEPSETQTDVGPADTTEDAAATDAATDAAATDTATDAATDGASPGDAVPGDVAVDSSDDTGPGTPEAFPVEACDEVSSTDVLPTGMYTFTGEGCVGSNPLEAAGILCPDAVLVADPAPEYEWSGFILVDEATYAREMFTSATGTAWFPQSCVDTLGGGTCDGVQAFILSLAPDADLVCSDDATFGGCGCTATAVGRFADAGTYVMTEGNFAIEYLHTVVSDPVVVAINYDVANEGDEWLLKSGEFEGSQDQVSSVTRSETFTACESYCAHFVGGCQGSEEMADVAQYDDYADCLNVCDGFVVTGAEQPVTSGDSLECRMYHLGVAVDPSELTNMTTHCPHAQAVPTAVCVD